MSLTLIAPPAEEPVALADLKAFLKIDGADEDALLATLIRAARAHLEALTARGFVTQTWRIARDAWPAHGRMSLPIGPVASLDAVMVTGAAGPVSVSPDLFALDGAGTPPRLAWAPGSLPAPAVAMAGIAVDVTVGWGEAADVPPALVQAVRLLAAHWFENRVPASPRDDIAVLPRTVEALIAPFLPRRVA